MRKSTKILLTVTLLALVLCPCVEAGRAAVKPRQGLPVVMTGQGAVMKQGTQIEEPFDLIISSTEGGSVTDPGEGTYVIDSGTVVSVAATAGPCYQFAGWTGTAVDAGQVDDPSAAETTVVVDADYTLVANFTKLRFKVEITSAGDGTASLVAELEDRTQTWLNNNTVELDCGTEVFIFATPDDDYHFTSWEGTIGSTCDYVWFVVTENMNYRAHFERNPKTLKVSSDSNGSVVVPGEGDYVYPHGTAVRALALPNSGYVFAGWDSTIDSVDPNCVRVDLEMIQSGTLHAKFEPAPEILYVDDDAVSDPGSGDALIGDPNEDGSLEHPFDSIQEAIAVAEDGCTILIMPGTYFENIKVGSKAITISSLDREQVGVISQTCVNGGQLGSVVSFDGGGCTNAVLAGLTIVAGDANEGGGIYCSGADPVIANCVIAGCRAESGSAMLLSDSRASVVNCTVADNYSLDAGIVCSKGDVLILDSILWNNLPEQLMSVSDAKLSVMYSDVQGGWNGEGNLGDDPLFAYTGDWVDPNDLTTSIDPSIPEAFWVDGDYHLSSAQGRWDPLVMDWVVDETTSPCIDAGNPERDPGSELDPNGDVINIGAFGGTESASLSPK